MKVVAIVSAKGGVGKTTVTANLATALAYAGHPVVAVDLDPQNALRFHFGFDPHDVEGISRSTLAGVGWRDNCLQSERGVVLLPYGLLNEEDRRHFEQILDADPGWLASHLAELGLPGNTLVLLDTPPGPSVYLRHALTLADMVVVVTLPDAASYATLPMMDNLVQSYCDGRPGFLGQYHLINQADTTRQLAADVAQVMRHRFGAKVIGTIHRDQAVAEALAYDKSVLDYARDSQAAEDFLAVTQAVSKVLAGKARAAR
ncbi:MAG: cellulose biosynthesis protein BcsQ [Pseudomonadota bacterium]